jgi:hypothetical protein
MWVICALFDELIYLVLGSELFQFTSGTIVGWGKVANDDSSATFIAETFGAFSA